MEINQKIESINLYKIEFEIPFEGHSFVIYALIFNSNLLIGCNLISKH